MLTVQALRDGVVPPTLNLKDLDPEIDLDVVADRPRRGDYRYAVTNSFGFGGQQRRAGVRQRPDALSPCRG